MTDVNGKLQVGTTRIHLDASSPLITKHHTNWRIKAINSFERPNENNLNYSTVYSMSKKDCIQIKKMILDFVHNIETIIHPSPEEVVQYLLIDFIELN